MLENVMELNALTLFGLVAVTLMLAFYALERRSHWFILAFSGSCVLASAYGFMQGAWPFGLIEAVWSGVALRRWWLERRSARLRAVGRVSQDAVPVGASLPKSL
jgi:hypothetical protein